MKHMSRSGLRDFVKKQFNFDLNARKSFENMLKDFAVVMVDRGASDLDEVEKKLEVCMKKMDERNLGKQLKDMQFQPKKTFKVDVSPSCGARLQKVFNNMQYVNLRDEKVLNPNVEVNQMPIPDLETRTVFKEKHPIRDWVKRWLGIDDVKKRIEGQSDCIKVLSDSVIKLQEKIK